MNKVKDNQYYLVPLSARFLKVGDDTLFDVLSLVDEGLAKRDREKKELLYGGDYPEAAFAPEMQKIAAKFEYETKVLYEERGIPYNLILVSNDEGLKELASDEDIKCDNECFLKSFNISGEDVVDIFTRNEEYVDQAQNLFELYHSKKNVRTSFFKKFRR
jgi:hypothetical protein